MTSTIPYIPPEILQMIFHNLDFYNLLRCQQVCKTWRAHLPGNDRMLRHRLFVNYPRADDNKDNSDHLQPHFVVPLVTSAGVYRFADPLPFLSFQMGLDTDPEIETCNLALPSYSIHPMFRNLKENMYLIHKSLFTFESGKPKHWFDFHTLKELGMMTRELENGPQHNDGSWKDMLLCVPPLPLAHITFKLGPGRQPEYKYTLDAKNEGGVTLGQFAAVFREHLKSMEKHMRNFYFQSLQCLECGEIHSCFCD